MGQRQEPYFKIAFMCMMDEKLINHLVPKWRRSVCECFNSHVPGYTAFRAGKSCRLQTVCADILKDNIAFNVRVKGT